MRDAADKMNAVRCGRSFGLRTQGVLHGAAPDEQKMCFCLHERHCIYEVVQPLIIIKAANIPNDIRAFDAQ